LPAGMPLLKNYWDIRAEKTRTSYFIVLTRRIQRACGDISDGFRIHLGGIIPKRCEFSPARDRHLLAVR